MSRHHHGQGRPRRHQPAAYAVVCPCGLGMAWSPTASFYCPRCDEKVDHAH